MEEFNILEDCKSILDPIMCSETTDFDKQILGIIEATILPLTQLGCIKPLYHRITEETSWHDIINPPSQAFDYDNTFSAIRTYVRYNVRITFDPPVSNVIEIYQKAINEAFFRIEVAYELQGK